MTTSRVCLPVPAPGSRLPAASSGHRLPASGSVASCSQRWTPAVGCRIPASGHRARPAEASRIPRYHLRLPDLHYPTCAPEADSGEPWFPVSPETSALQKQLPGNPGTFYSPYYFASQNMGVWLVFGLRCVLSMGTSWGQKV